MFYKSNLKILLADDHSYLRKGLSQELESVGYGSIQTCNDGRAAIRMLEHEDLDIALLDIEMPHYNGFEIAEYCQLKSISTPIIFLSYHKEKSYVAAAKKIGVRGFMLKEDPIQQIDICIQHVMRGLRYFSEAFGGELFNHLNNELENLQLLTKSEKRILQQIASGKSSAEISALLRISKRTVEKHRSNIISKLDPPDAPFSLHQWASKNKNLIEKL